MSGRAIARVARPAIPVALLLLDMRPRAAWPSGGELRIEGPFPPKRSRRMLRAIRAGGR